MDIPDHSESINAGGEVNSRVVISQGAPNDYSKDHSSMSSSENLQPSIFSLTLGEIQTRSGMSFESMNMDELIKIVLSDDFQVPSNVEQEPSNGHQNGLIPQKSVSASTPLFDKTVNEVWAEIQENSQTQSNQVDDDFDRFMAGNEVAQLQTVGEMTLEEFLAAAGIIGSEPPPASLPMPEQHRYYNNQPQSNQGGFNFTNGSCFNGDLSVGQGMGYEYSMHTSSVNGNGINSLMSDGSSAFNMFSPGSGVHIGEPTNVVENGKFNVLGESNFKKRKYYIPTELEVGSDRKLKRMIKNRESAARSRARKQAYTEELEKELKKLKAENMSLELSLKIAKWKSKHEKKAERKSKKEGGKKDLEKKGSFGRLRRTKSALW